MSQQKILQVENISSNSLLKEIDEIVTKRLSAIAERKTIETELISRQNVADIFGITLPTVHAWTNAGILQAYKIGNKTRFKKSEVLQACKPIKEIS